MGPATALLALALIISTATGVSVRGARNLDAGKVEGMSAAHTVLSLHDQLTSQCTAVTEDGTTLEETSATRAEDALMVDTAADAAEAAALQAAVEAGRVAPKFNCRCNSQAACTGTVFFDAFNGGGGLTSPWTRLQGSLSKGGGVLRFSSYGGRHFGPYAVVKLDRAYSNYRVRTRTLTHRGGLGHVWRYNSPSSFFSDFHWWQNWHYISLNGREGTYRPRRHYHFNNWYDVCTTVKGGTSTYFSLGNCGRTDWSVNTAGFQGGLTSSPYVGLAAHASSTGRISYFEVQATVYPVYAREHFVPYVATAGVGFSHTLESTAFVPRDSAPLYFTAKLASGKALPAWLKFNSKTGTLSGTPPRGLSHTLYRIVVKAEGGTKYFGGARIGCAQTPLAFAVKPAKSVMVAPKGLIAGATADAGVCAGKYTAAGQVVKQWTNCGATNSLENLSGLLTITETSFLDYTLSLFMRNDDDDMMGVVFRASSKASYYLFGFSGADTKKGNTGNTMVLARHVGNKKTVLWSAKATQARSTWYHVMVKAIRNVITVYVDMKRVVTYTDTSAAALMSGGFGTYSAHNEPSQWASMAYTLDTSQIKDATKSVTSLKLVDKDLKIKVDEFSSQSSKAERESGTVEGNLLDEQKRTESMTIDVEKLKAKHMDLTSAVKRLEGDIVELRKSIKAILDPMKESRDKAKAEVVPLEQRNAELSKVAAARSKKFMEAWGKVKVMQASADKAQEELQEGRDHLKYEISKLKVREQELKHQLESFIKQRDAMSALIDKMKAKSMAPLKAKIAEANTKATAAHADADSAMRNMEDSKTMLTESYAALEASRKRLTDMRSQYSREAEEHHVAIGGMEDTMGPLRIKGKEFQQQADLAAKEAETAEAEAKDLRKKRDETSSSIEAMLRQKSEQKLALQRQIAGLDRAVRDQHLDIDRTAARVESVKQHVAAADAKRTSLTKDIANMEDTRTTAVGQTVALQGHAQDLRSDASQVAAREIAAREAVKAKKADLEALPGAGGSAAPAASSSTSPEVVATKTTSLATPVTPPAKEFGDLSHPVYGDLEVAQQGLGINAEEAEALEARRQKARDESAALQMGTGAPAPLLTGSPQEAGNNPAPQPAASGDGRSAASGSNPHQGAFAAAVEQAANGVPLGQPPPLLHTMSSTVTKQVPPATPAGGSGVPQGASGTMDTTVTA